MLTFKLFVTIHPIRTYAKHYDALISKCTIVIANIACLDRAGGGIVFRIEIQYYLFTLKVFQRYDIAILIGELKLRRFIALL